MKKRFKLTLSILLVISMMMFVGCGNDFPETDDGGAGNAVNGDPNVANPNLGANNAGLELPEGYEEDRAKCETRMNELLKEGYSYEGLKDKLMEEGFEINIAGSVAADAYNDTDWVEQAKIFVESRLNGKGYSVAMLRRELTEAQFKEEEIDQALWNVTPDYKYEACLAAITTSKDESYCHHRESIRQELEFSYEFKLEEVEYAMENAEVDWNALAIKYMAQIDSQSNEFNAYSRLMLETCVGNGHLTWDEIQYGIEMLGVDWNKRAAEYLDSKSYDRHISKNEYIQLLIDEKFTEEEAKYGILHCKYDWKDNASAYVLEHSWDFENISQVKDALRAEGYTQEEVDYAVSEWSDYYS